MENRIWNKCKEFHGHECGGLTIGYKAALYAIKLLDLKEEEKEGQWTGLSPDEELSAFQKMMPVEWTPFR